MTRTAYENAQDEMREEKIREAADAQVLSDPSLMIEDDQKYEDWLAATGLDKSFVGNGGDIPGSGDLYEAALRYKEVLDMADMPSP